MRKTLFVICLLALPYVCLAQSNQSFWSNLNALQPGQRIEVAESTSTKHSGTFVVFSETAIKYRDASGEQSVQKENIRTVKLMENKHRLRNALICAGVGAGIGAVIGAASTQQTGSILLSVSRGQGAAVGAVLGVFGGAVVGVLLPSHSTIYNAGTH